MVTIKTGRNNNMNEGIKKIIENAVFAESVIQECRQKHQTEVVEKLNRLLMDKAQEAGVSLYEVCGTYIPEITSELIEYDPYKEKREWPGITVKTTIKLVLRQ